MLVSLLVLAFAVAGLAMTVRAQQDAAPQPTAISSENQASDNQSAENQAPEHASSEKPEKSEMPRPSEPSPVSACPPDTILVKVNSGADPSAVIARHGGTIVRTIGGIDVQVVEVPGGTGQQAIDALSADPDVKYAEADQIVRASEAGGGC
jgi:hypothetical protein